MGAAAALLEDEAGGVVYVWGSAAFSWDASDVAARRFAAVQLVVAKTAKPAHVARAFGVSTTTLWRWQSDFSDRGLLGLIADKRGPKAQRALDQAGIERARLLREEGKSLREIASELNCSTSPVRQALGLIGQARLRDTGTEGSDESTRTSDHGADEEATTTEEATEETINTANNDGGDGATDGASRTLAPLAQPAARRGERALARWGLLGEARPVFTEGAGLPRLGMLLVLPALQVTGLLDAAGEVYASLKNGFYGLVATILTMVFLALAREPRAEGATRIAPADLGRLLGLDRAPEVKTIRRKLAELAQRGLGSKLVSALAARHAQADPEALGYLYIDGHVRVYTGEKDLQKAHVTRTRIAAPATLETWVNDQRGDPVLVVTAELSASLVAEIRCLLPSLRALVGDKRRVTIVFDRGGWSPELFAEMLEAGFDFMTYRKGKVPNEPARAFSEQRYQADDGVTYVYDLADRRVRLRLKKKHNARKTLSVRQVVRRTDNGHQTQIVTSRTDLSAAEVAYRMFNRWRQENYFRYARAHFCLDGLDSYAATPDDPDRSVPNPKRKLLQAKLRRAKSALLAAEAKVGEAAANNTESTRPTMRGFKIANAALTKAVNEARAEVARLQTDVAQTPTRVPLSTIRPQACVLDEERKLVTHAIRMATYNAESVLARLLIGHFPIDESRALLREAFNTPGDLEVIGSILDVRLDPLSAPRRTRALTALCEQLTAAQTTYPGTNLTLRYSVKDAPGIA
jgi:transposase-like protein